ncbi:MAG TPA: DUF3105 domain-containing protein [Acidimicrobiia bacterium]|nr:DUF3105 domain-containing protein [Acidimicrobiia bacterium]
MSKKLHEKQQRRLAQEAKKARQKKEHRRANLITVGIAAAVAIAVVVIIVLSGGTDPAANVGVAASEANCTDRETFESEGDQHVDVGTPVQYEANPPTTGNHWPTEAIAPTGFSEEPIAAESVVHNQEHGMIAVYYNPDAPDEVLGQIEELVDQERTATVGLPWDEIEDPYNFVLTAWDGANEEGVQMSCELPSQEVWNEWRTDFQGRGPENVGTPTFSSD